MENTVSVTSKKKEEAKETFFRFEKDALRRVGVILRLVSIPVALIGILLAIILPTVTIEYANY